MNGKTSINSICPNLWTPTAGLLQGLTVLQQCVYQKKFKNVCNVKKWLVEPVLVRSRTLSILQLSSGPVYKCHSGPPLQAVLL